MKRAVIRLPADLVDRLDLLARELRREHPEASYSRASVARALLASALVMIGARDDRSEGRATDEK